MSDTVTLVENHGTQSVVEQDEADKLLLLSGHDRYEVEWDAEARVTPKARWYSSHVNGKSKLV